MFCPNCGKTIDDNATFCGFCGSPTGVAASTPVAEPQPAPSPVIPQNTVPQNTVPQYTAPQNVAPQNIAPQNPMPQGSVPPYAPVQQQPTVGGAGFSLDAKTTDIINKSIRGALIILSILIIIGSIGSMAVAGAISTAFKTLNTSALGSASDAKAFYDLARVPSIIAFVISAGGLAFTIFTKQRSLFSYICAGAGLLLFIFNFVMYGGYVSLWTSLTFSSWTSLLTGVKTGGIVVASVFLLISALIMAAASVIIILKKEDIIKFKPKF